MMKVARKDCKGTQELFQGDGTQNSGTDAIDRTRSYIKGHLRRNTLNPERAVNTAKRSLSGTRALIPSRELISVSETNRLEPISAGVSSTIRRGLRVYLPDFHRAHRCCRASRPRAANPATTGINTTRSLEEYLPTVRTCRTSSSRRSRRDGVRLVSPC